MRFLFSLLLVSLFCVSCTRSLHKADRTAIVKVGDHILSQEELDRNLNPVLTPEDSIIQSEHFVRSWINDQLLFDVASKNIGNKEAVEKLVENYKRSLIVYQYQEQLINEKLDKEISDESLLRFYEDNKEGFILDRPLVKGLYLKIPQGALQINDVKTWYKSINPANIEKIEKYSIQNSAIYNYFVDQWVDFYELTSDWPVNYKSDPGFIRRNVFVEQQDTNFHYLLHATDFLLPGETTPFEYTKPIIKEMLLNQKKAEFLKKIEEDLYQRALNRRQIIFYNE
jgi:hypothetical protein